MFILLCAFRVEVDVRVHCLQLLNNCEEGIELAVHELVVYLCDDIVEGLFVAVAFGAVEVVGMFGSAECLVGRGQRLDYYE